MKMNIGILLRMRRESLGFSQEEMSIMLANYRKKVYGMPGAVSVAHSTISRMETDPLSFKMRDLEDYATVMGIDLGILFFVSRFSSLLKPNQMLDLLKHEKTLFLNNLMIHLFGETMKALANNFTEMLKQVYNNKESMRLWKL